MQAIQISIEDFRPDHIEGAFALSQQAGWPHRREDWAMSLSIGQGLVATEDSRVVGTAVITCYANDAATVGIVIVDEAMRGRGLGRRLMDEALKRIGDRPCRLTATTDGLPLYRKLGFEVIGEIAQHQGLVGPVGAETPADIRTAQPADLADFLAMDRDACGMDRSDLLKQLAQTGTCRVLRTSAGIGGFSVVRRFGRGDLIGPVIAASSEQARALIAHDLASRTGQFVRVDAPVEAGLGPWLAARGLAHVGGGTVMTRGDAGHAPNVRFRIFALASQALG